MRRGGQRHLAHHLPARASSTTSCARATSPPLLATLNHHLVTTLGACGDVVRNIMCCPAPLSDRRLADVGAYAQEAARRFRPRTQAYNQLWLDGERAVTAEAPGEEPLYGTTYLPGKFTIGFAFPGDNCIDVYSNDIGVVPALDGE